MNLFYCASDRFLWLPQYHPTCIRCCKLKSQQSLAVKQRAISPTPSETNSTPTTHSKDPPLPPSAALPHTALPAPQTAAIRQ